MRAARHALAGVNLHDWSFLGGVLSWYEPPLPLYLRSSGYGDFFTSGGVMEPYGGYRPASFVSPTTLERAPIGIWGDVMLDTLCCGFQEDGFYELVRYDEAVNPGDVLVLQRSSGSDPVTLFKSGPRGGLAHIWPGVDENIVDVAGMDLGGDMRLCIADAGANMLWELEPAGPRAAPELVRYSEAVEGIVDCAYAADGSLVVLAQAPPRRLFRPANDDFAALTLDEQLPARPEPLELIHKPDGTLETRFENDGLRGKTYLRDGRAITMRDDDFTVRVDDQPIAEIPRLVFVNYLSNLNPNFGTRVLMRVRPDGLIVVLPHHAAPSDPYATIGKGYVVDPAGGEVLELAVGDYFATWGLGAVVVPGGSEADPWTGRIGAPLEVELPPGVGAPNVPLAPTGGEKIATGSSCRAVNTGELTWLALVMALFIASGRVPRAREARRPSAR